MIASKFRRVRRVSRVHVPGVVRHVFTTKPIVRLYSSPGPNICTSSCATLDSSTWIRVLASVTLLFAFLSAAFAFPIICVFDQSAPWINFVRKSNEHGRRESCTPKVATYIQIRI